jgi:hypothetical protein
MKTILSFLAVLACTSAFASGSDSKSDLPQSDPAFREFVLRAEAIIASNDFILSELKNHVTADRKFQKLVARFNQENQELKSELEKYVHYGTGDWKIFRQEFNLDLTLVVHDLEVLSKQAGERNLMASGTK